jgi:hypothetical protein
MVCCSLVAALILIVNCAPGQPDAPHHFRGRPYATDRTTANISQSRVAQTPANSYPLSPIVQQIIDSVRIDTLISLVSELSGEVPTTINGTSQTILSRHREQPGNALAEAYLRHKLESYGLPVTTQNYSATGNNVFAMQVGTSFPARKFIISAHYDCNPAGPVAHGAEDDGAGVAAVIEAARILSKHSFPYTIVYALWDEEEVGLLGSLYYAAQAAAGKDSILGVVNLDGIGWDSNNDGNCGVQELDIVHAVQIRPHMEEINSQYGIGVTIVHEPQFSWSDQAPFWYNGFDAVEVEEDDFRDDDPHYHTADDRVQNLNSTFFLKMTKLALGTVGFLALGLSFDMVHTPIDIVVPSQVTHASVFIHTDLPVASGSSAPRLYYRSRSGGGDYGAFNMLSAGSAHGDKTYDFHIPALASGTSVQYYAAAQDENSTVVTTSPPGGGGFGPPGSIPPSTFHEFLVADLTEVWSDSANDMTQWTPTGGWNITTGQYVSPPTSFTDSPGGTYPSFSTSTLRYKGFIQGLTATKCFLQFDARWAMEFGFEYDYASVQISVNGDWDWTPLKGQYTYMGRGTNYVDLEPYYGGVQQTWVHEIVDISNYAKFPFTLRFERKSGDHIPLGGWYIDNVRLSTFVITGVEAHADVLPTRFSLLQNYPNPFNPTTVVSCQSPVVSRVRLVVYDLLGREVATLMDERKEPGRYDVTWNASGCASGVYICRMQAGDFVSTKKLLLIR